jgi:hypothetical protein
LAGFVVLACNRFDDVVQHSIVDVGRHRARTAADAELELTRVRQTRTALIERAIAFGSLDAPSYFRSALAEGKWIINMLSWGEGQRRVSPPRPVADDPSASMP